MFFDDDREEVIACRSFLPCSPERSFLLKLPLKIFRSDSRPQVLLPIFQRLQLSIRRHAVLPGIPHGHFAVFRSRALREVARTVEVEIGNEMVAVKDIDPWCVDAPDVPVSHL